MKKFNTTSLIAGVIVGLVLASGFSIFAKDNFESIDALMNGVDVYIDQQKTDVKTILYNDTTYVPLRYISESFGIPVNYIESTNSVVLGKWYEGKDQYYVPPKENNNTVVNTVKEDNNVANKESKKKSGVSAKQVLDNPQYLIDLTGIRLDVEDNMYGNPTIWATNYSKNKDDIITGVNVKMSNYTTNKYVFGDGVGYMWGNGIYGAMLPNVPESDLYSKKSIEIVIPGLNSVKRFETDDIYITEISITYLREIVEKRKGMVDYLVEETINYDFTKDNITGISLGKKNNQVR